MINIKKLFNKKNIEYISFTYTDIYKSLFQSFMISKREFEETNYKTLNYHISNINKNLTLLHNITLYKKDHKPYITYYYNKKGKICDEYKYKKENK